MAAECRCDLERYGRFGPVIGNLDLDRGFGRNDALKFERMNAAKERRQIEALSPACDHPVDLHHSWQNRSTGKVAIKIEQVPRRNELKYGLMRMFFNQTFTRLRRPSIAEIEQRPKLGNGCLTLGIDR